GLAREESCARYELPEHDRKREEIRLPRDGPALDLFRRHVRKLPLEAPLLRRLRSSRGLRDAEIEDARDAIESNEDVLRRDVAMHDVERLVLFVCRLVCSVKPLQNVYSDAQKDRDRHLLVPLSDSAHEAAQ